MHSQVLPCNHAYLPTIGNGRLKIIGLLPLKLDLGFSKFFEFCFYVTNHSSYGILGADFLQTFGLAVDVASRRLIHPHDPTRHSQFSDEKSPSEFEPSSTSDSSGELLTHFQSCFPEVFEPMSRSRTIRHSIIARVETTTETPVWSKARRLSPEKLNALKEEVSRLVSQGILTESHSAWSSPIVMVKKPSGKFRLCADFVALNKILVKSRYPLPNIHDFSVMSANCRIFSCLDIVDAYYQIPVDPSCSEKLTITTPIGCFKYLFLPMGLATSSNYFQRLMNDVLAGIPRVFVYLDDIFVMSETMKEHRNTLHMVFERLKTHGLIVNHKKCIFGVDNLHFLGHHISAEGLRPSQTNVDAILTYKQPTTRKQLLRFLGMVQFYSRFLPNLALHVGPLYNSTHGKYAKITWSPDTVWHFQQVKSLLANATVLAHPNSLSNIELITDASETAMGAVLNQVSNGHCQPLAFWSKTLKPHEQKWSCFERELFACYSAIRHFRYFLESRDFILKTDHKPIVAKFQSSSPASSPRQARFFDYITQFTNKVEHVSGSKNVADALSRPVESSAINAILPNTPSIDYLTLAREQERDPEVSELRHNNTTSLSLVEVPLADHDVSVLCDDSQGRLRPIAPSSMRLKIFQHIHNWSHPGVTTGNKLVGSRFVWPGMRKDVAQWTRECQACAKTKINRHNVAPLDFVSPPPKGRFTHIYVDLTGPLGTSKGYNYIMVVIDRFSRYFQAIPLVGITAEECVDAFTRHWVAIFGCPEHIFCDRGTQFTSSMWSEMCQYLGCYLHHSTAYHPQA